MATTNHQVSDVVSARPGPNDVVLNFGLTRADNAAEAAVSIDLMRRISMTPQTARQFRDMLRNLIADADAAAAKDRS